MAICVDRDAAAIVLVTFVLAAIVSGTFVVVVIVDQESDRPVATRRVRRRQIAAEVGHRVVVVTYVVRLIATVLVTVSAVMVIVGKGRDRRASVGELLVCQVDRKRRVRGRGPSEGAISLFRPFSSFVLLPAVFLRLPFPVPPSLVLLNKLCTVNPA